jgi:hypothetical protein
MGIDRQTIDLINAGIDGELSAEEKAMLDERLAASDEARALCDELRDLCGSLDALPAEDVPDDVRPGVLARLSVSAVKAENEAGSRLGEIFAGLFGVPLVRYGMSFAAGVILTFTLISSDQVSRQAFDDVAGLVGTISGGSPVEGSATRQDGLELALNELAGSVSLSTAGSLMILDFDLASRDPVEIVARFDDRDIWFSGFAQQESEGTTVDSQTGRVTVRMSGQRRYAVFLQNAGQNAATVNLSFMSAGQVLHEGALRLPATE